jgi:hypothetical protein
VPTLRLFLSFYPCYMSCWPTIQHPTCMQHRVTSTSQQCLLVYPCYMSCWPTIQHPTHAKHQSHACDTVLLAHCIRNAPPQVPVWAMVLQYASHGIVMNGSRKSRDSCSASTMRARSASALRPSSRRSRMRSSAGTNSKLQKHLRTESDHGLRKLSNPHTDICKSFAIYRRNILLRAQVGMISDN